MFRRATAIFLITLANISLLTIAAIPHHHHHENVCFHKFHHHPVEENDHDTCPDPEHSQNNGPDLCIFKTPFIIPSGQAYQPLQSTGYTDNHSPLNNFSHALLLNQTIESVPVAVLVASYIHPISSYSIIPGPSAGLRAPPQV